MSVRVVSKIENKHLGAPSYITKKVEMDRLIPFCYDINDLENIKDVLTDKEYIALYQQFTEMRLYDEADWRERESLAPLIDVYYDKNNCPVLVFPYFTPLQSEAEAQVTEDDAVIDVLRRIATQLGVDDETLGYILTGITDFCYAHELDESEMLLNLNNLGYNEHFGIRVIDYGMTTELREKFSNKEHL